jgi:hypothetical protein
MVCQNLQLALVDAERTKLRVAQKHFYVYHKKGTILGVV